jgi:hypothetical protein
MKAVAEIMTNLYDFKYTMNQILQHVPRGVRIRNLDSRSFSDAKPFKEPKLFEHEKGQPEFTNHLPHFSILLL